MSLNTNGRQALGSGIAFLVVAIIAVALRFYTKTLTKAKWAADDWWISLSLIGFCGWIGAEFWGISSGGGGENIQAIGFDFVKLQSYLKSLYTAIPLYAFTMTASKISILCFYRRIFVSKSFRQITLVVGGLCALWWIVFTIAALVPCRPVKKFWYPRTPGHCYSFSKGILGVPMVDILVDAAILVLPIPPILRLQMPNSRKALLCAIFLVGGFVVITGIVRLCFTYVPGSDHIDFTRGQLWTNIHLGTAILCACLPIFRPTLSHFADLAASLSSQLNSLFSSRRQFNRATDSEEEYTMGKLSKDSKRYKSLNEAVRKQEVLHQANVVHAVGRRSSDKASDTERDCITVENSVEVV